MVEVFKKAAAKAPLATLAAALVWLVVERALQLDISPLMLGALVAGVFAFSLVLLVLSARADGDKQANTPDVEIKDNAIKGNHVENGDLVVGIKRVSKHGE